mgnify:CR=1 FL=1
MPYKALFAYIAEERADAVETAPTADSSLNKAKKTGRHGWIYTAITAAAAACGFVFVLNLLIPLSDRKNYILMALGIVCAVIGAIVAKGALFLQVWAIGCATAAPTAAILLALDHWKKRKITQKLGYGRVVRDGTIGLFFAVVVAMIGGLYIAAMLGNIRFFMEFDF